MSTEEIMQSEAVKNADSLDLLIESLERRMEDSEGINETYSLFSHSSIRQIIHAAQSPASAVEVTDEIAGIVKKMTELTEAEVWDGDWSEDCQDFWNDGDAKKLVDWLNVIVPRKPEDE